MHATLGYYRAPPPLNQPNIEEKMARAETMIAQSYLSIIALLCFIYDRSRRKIPQSIEPHTTGDRTPTERLLITLARRYSGENAIP